MNKSLEILNGLQNIIETSLRNLREKIDPKSEKLKNKLENSLSFLSANFYLIAVEELHNKEQAFNSSNLLKIIKSNSERVSEKI